MSRVLSTMLFLAAFALAAADLSSGQKIALDEFTGAVFPQFGRAQQSTNILDGSISWATSRYRTGTNTSLVITFTFTDPGGAWIRRTSTNSAFAHDWRVKP